MNPPHSQSEEIFHRLLDESAVRLAAPASAGIAIPDDDLHREIIVPLLPAMLGDKSIRQHWSEQAATGFPARLARHFENGEPAPRWLPGDFEIHVTASYSAGADARALADTLLSEDSLRDMSAALMNQLLEVLWPSLAPAPTAVPVEPPLAAEISEHEIATLTAPVPGAAPATEPPVSASEVPVPKIAAPADAPAAAEFSEPVSEPIISEEAIPDPVWAVGPEPEPSIESEPQILPSAIPRSAIEHELAERIPPAEVPSAHQPPSRALIRAMCRKISAAAFQRGLVANSATHDASTAIVARRIFQRATMSRTRQRVRSRPVRLG